MFDKNYTSVWNKLDVELVKRRIHRINRWFEPFLINDKSQTNLEDLKDSQTKNSKFNNTSKKKGCE